MLCFSNLLIFNTSSFENFSRSRFLAVAAPFLNISFLAAAGKFFPLIFNKFSEYLEVFDDHHNEYSSWEEMKCLEVIGCTLTEKIKKICIDFEFISFEPTLNGFIAKR